MRAFCYAMAPWIMWWSLNSKWLNIQHTSVIWFIEASLCSSIPYRVARKQSATDKKQSLYKTSWSGCTRGSYSVWQIHWLYLKRSGYENFHPIFSSPFAIFLLLYPSSSLSFSFFLSFFLSLSFTCLLLQHFLVNNSSTPFRLSSAFP